MATITVNNFLDQGTARTAGEAWTINSGAVLTTRTDTRWHSNSPVSMGIYYIKNTINNKYYVGQSVNIRNRILQHIREIKKGTKNGAIYQALRKYGIETFEFGVCCLCERSELNTNEEKYVELLKSTAPNGYNLTTGGNSKTVISDITREKISVAQKGRKKSLEEIQKISNSLKGRKSWNKGKKTTGKALEVIIARNKSRIGIPAWNKGTKTPEDVCAKISAKHKGKITPEETRKKLSKTLTGRKITWGNKISVSSIGRSVSQESRDKLSRTLLKGSVIKCSNGKTYNSIKNAAIDIGITTGSNISAVIAGRRKSVKGLVFWKEVENGNHNS